MYIFFSEKNLLKKEKKEEVDHNSWQKKIKKHQSNNIESLSHYDETPPKTIHPRAKRLE